MTIQASFANRSAFFIRRAATSSSTAAAAAAVVGRGKPATLPLSSFQTATRSFSRSFSSKARSLGSLASSDGSSHSHSHSFLQAALISAASAAAASFFVTDVTRCDESLANDRNGSGNDQDDSDLPPNPLWPSGVPQDMVNSFVDEILADKDINIAAIPDSIERQIYVSTVQLTLNAVYESVGGFHGMEILGHCIELHRVDENHDDGKEPQKGIPANVRQRVKQAYASNAFGPGSIDHAALESVADRLLANKAVNQPLVPDIVERQLYVNCLKLIFRLLDAVASTLRVTLCGHDVRIHFEPCADQSTRQWINERLRKRASETSARLTVVDLRAVEQYAREVGAAPVDPELGWVGRILDYGQREMIIQLNKTLYALVLGILDDLLEDTILTFLSDRIRLDVVSKKRKGKATEGAAAPKEENIIQSVSEPSGAEGLASKSAPDSAASKNIGVAVPLSAFAFGVSVGAAATFLAGTRRQ